MALLENLYNAFGTTLFSCRRAIEQFFGHLTAVGYDLSALPPWIRALERVRRWVAAKLLLITFMRAFRKRKRRA